MINPINNSDLAFKSGPWYTKFLTDVTRADAFGPIVALEGTVDTGRAVNAYKRGGKNELRERMIEDITGGIVWLFGVKSLNALGDKILNKLYGGNFDVGTDKVLRTPFDNFIKRNTGKTFAKNPKAVAVVKAIKVLTSVVLADAFIGLVVPKMNQKLTRTLIARDKEKEAKNNQSTLQNKETKPSEVAFKGGGGMAALNVFTNAIENTNIGKLLSTDVGLVSGRMYSARNADERREIAIRDIGSAYFFYWASGHVGNLLNLIESGRATRLNPDSANILNDHLIKFVEANGGEMDVEKFKELVLGKKTSEITLPEGIAFETGELSWFEKMFDKKKEPLKVAKVSDLEKVITDEKIMTRIKEMSKLQPLRQGEAVITKQQIIDALNIAEINDPKMLDAVFDKFTGGAHKDEFKYISYDKLIKLKSEMEAYIEDLCKTVKDKKITKDVLNQVKNKNLVYNGINFAAGFAFAALFLSSLIPKFQYWVTKKKSGIETFPGTYDYSASEAKKA